jgi:hypothetical protein
LEIVSKDLQMMVQALLCRVLIRNDQDIPSDGGRIICRFDQNIRDLHLFNNVGPMRDVFATWGLSSVPS